MLIDDLRATGKQFYCISFTIRSGSTLLCHDLDHWGLGNPTEYFQSPAYEEHRSRGTVSQYIRQLVEESQTDVFGFKIAWGQACVLTQCLFREGIGSGEIDLSTIFPDLTHIRISRRDPVRQAVSAWRATMSGTWHWVTGDPRPSGKPRYDFEALNGIVQRLLLEEALWTEHFRRRGLNPLEIEYETYVRTRAQTMSAVAAALGREPERRDPPDHLQPMADDWTEQIVERFWRDANDLNDLPGPTMAHRLRRAGRPASRRRHS